MTIDQRVALMLIADGLKSGDIRGSVAGALEELLDQVRRGSPPMNGFLSYRCWILLDPDGNEAPGSAHFGLKQHAEVIRATYLPIELRDRMSVRQHEMPCVVLVCSCCRDPYDITEHREGAGPEVVEGGCVHHPSVEAALAAGRAAGWYGTETEGADLLCARCVEADCPCAARSEYIGLMTSNKETLTRLPELLTAVERASREIRGVFDKIGQDGAYSDGALSPVDHTDAEQQLDQLDGACRALERMAITFDDRLTRELTRVTGKPYGRLLDPDTPPPF